ncbi:hypothetical protein D9M72_544930 [compost metagenome]
MIIGQPLHLAARRLDQPLLAEADRHAPKPRHALDIALAAVVVDVDALAAIDDQRPFPLQLARVGIGMEMVGHVPRFGGIRLCGHRRLPFDA